MEGRKPNLQHNPYAMHKTTSASAIGTGHVNKDKTRQSEGATPVDCLSQKPPLPGNSSGPNSTAPGGKVGGLKLGGLSRYLLEKAQSNDSGLDLSPATLQTLVHPIRTSNSSSSSLNVRNLFESSASSSEESPLNHAALQPVIDHPSNHHAAASNLSVSKSILSEQSHNASETTIIEKTLTDDQSSKDVSNATTRKDPLCPIYENDERRKATSTKESISNGKSHAPGNPTPTFHHPENVTPKDRGFHVPYAQSVHQDNKTKSRTSNGYNENNDPYNTPAARSYSGQVGYQHHQNNRSFPSSDVAAVIPSLPSGSSVTADQNRKTTMQTPRPKSCKKKQPVPSSTKKPTGSGWKFLSEHVKDQEFLILKQLGKGGCGEVQLVLEKDSKKEFALKTVQLHGIDEALVQECINEVEMLIDLKGTDLVVDIYNWEFNRAERTMKILMEKGQCDLNHTIFKSVKNKKPIRLSKLKDIWESMLLIVQEIHSKGIVHADLKPANFVWFEDSLKIIDFGIASRLQSDLTSIAMPNPKGTLNFISPEIIKLDDAGRSKLSPKSDIWALGCILYLMVYGRTPFDHITHPVTKMNAIVQGDIMYPTLPPHLRDSEVLPVLKLCFQSDYKRRPSATELLQHSFLRS